MSALAFSPRIGLPTRYPIGSVQFDQFSFLSYEAQLTIYRSVFVTHDPGDPSNDSTVSAFFERVLYQSVCRLYSLFLENTRTAEL